MVSGLRDSKLLSPKARERFYNEIIASSDWSVSEVSAKEIDRINIQRASLLAMRKAIMALEIPPDYVIVDGFRVSELHRRSFRPRRLFDEARRGERPRKS